MAREHRYKVSVVWRGNLGKGTRDYRAYSRDHEILSGDKPPIAGSSAAEFRGDGARWNPDELLVASLSACHQLWYLHLCAEAGVSVLAYEDDAEGVMAQDPDGGGRFVSAILRPRVAIDAGSDATLAERLHHDAHDKCFVARSVNFPVACEPVVVRAVE